MGNLNFDATDVAPNTAFDPLPPGWYAMRIIGAEMVDSDSAGPMLKVEHEIVAERHPDFANRKVFSRLCINHPTSEKAREIAQRTLSAIAHAIGKLKLADTDDLLGQAVQVKLKVRPADGKFDASNEVTGYRSIEESAEQPVAAAAPTAKPVAAPARPAAGSKPAWKR